MTTPKPIRIVLAKPGLDGHDQGAKVVARAMMDAGFEVIYTGLRQTPEQVARIALEEDVDVIALSSMAGSHLSFCRRLKPLLEQAGLADKLWIIGGNLPPQDHDELRALGFKGIFRTGSKLDAICDYLPSPLDLPPARGIHPKTHAEETRPADEAGPLLALAFKVSLLDEKRRFVFLRIYAGRIADGAEVWNASLGKAERVTRLLLVHAVQKTRIAQAAAGQIVAVMGLRETRTGDTLTDREHPLLLERISAYEPVISQAIETGTQAEREPLSEALARVADEDPTFRFGEDRETGQLLISGMGELHLEVVAERLRREFGLQVRTGRPQVLLRETIRAQASAESTFERTLDEEQVFGQVAVRVAPLPRGGGFRFALAPEVAALPFLRGEVKELLEQGAREAAESGALAGHPLQDVAVEVTAVGWREGASRTFAYKVAAADAVRSAAARAGPVLLEPVARVEVLTPEESLGEIIGSLDRRKGAILDVSDRGHGTKVVTSEAPLRSLFGYATELRSLTQGRAVFTMRFDRFDTVG